jgi:hypothetical protein
LNLMFVEALHVALRHQNRVSHFKLIADGVERDKFDFDDKSDRKCLENCHRKLIG